MPAAASVSRADSSSTLTANLNTAWPFICRNGEPMMRAAAHVARHREHAGVTAVGAQHARMDAGLLRKQPAPPRPAPSPKSTQVPRSFQSRMRENTSAPTTSAFLYCPERMKVSAVASA